MHNRAARPPSHAIESRVRLYENRQVIACAIFLAAQLESEGERKRGEMKAAVLMMLLVAAAAVALPVQWLELETAAPVDKPLGILKFCSERQPPC